MRSLVRGLAGVAVVAAIGFLWAHFGLKRTPGTPPPLDRQATVSGLSLRYPGAWHRAPGGPPLAGALALTSSQASGRDLEIANESPTRVTLPRSLRAALARVPAPQLVVLGGMSFRRYLDAPLAKGRGVASVYQLPTTAGTVTAVCSAPVFSTSFTGTCERILATVRPAGTVLSLRVQSGYALALNRILDALDAVRSKMGPGLRSRSTATRARAALALQRAHATAATAAAHITADGVSPGSVSAANPALVAALRRCATAYRALAAAATGHDAAAYAGAERAVSRSERALTAALQQFGSLGYHVK